MAGYVISYFPGFLSISIPTPWEMNLMPGFAKNTEAASQVVRLPVSVSAGLMVISLALSIMAGGLASLFMGRRTASTKPADILRKM
jgi:ABC-type antimicrobial peptide transport system permease subunit